MSTGDVAQSATFIGRFTVAACPLDDGASFDPATNAWTHVEAEGVTRIHPAAWWGDGRLGVWGGTDCSGAILASGATYDLVTKTWTPIPSGGPSGRAERAWWTGAEAIVWSDRGGDVYRP